MTQRRTHKKEREMARIRVITPKQPHFFKIIHPGNLHNIRIPESFIRKNYLRGGLGSGGGGGEAILRRMGGSGEWVVKMEEGGGWVFRGGGWERFVRENGVKFFDFLVFKHQGDLVFEVMVLEDSSTCDTQLSPPLSSSSSYNLSNNYQQLDSPPIPGGPENTMEEEGNAMSESREKSPAYSKVGCHPYFESIMTPYNSKKAELHIPAIFARAYGLANRNCEVIIVDEEKRSWSANLRHRRSHIVLNGWRNCQRANGIQVGDAYMLELIQQGEKPVMNFYFLRDKGTMKKPIIGEVTMDVRDEIKTEPDIGDREVIETEPDIGDRHSFVGKFHKTALYIPKRFAMRNGLSSGDMILIKNRRQWLVKATEKNGYIYVTRGWHEFLVYNDMKEGDCFKCELVKNGATPILSISDNQSSKSVELVSIYG